MLQIVQRFLAPVAFLNQMRVQNRSAIVFLFSFLFAVSVAPLYSQELVLTVASGQVNAGSEITLPLTVASPGVAGLQWTYTYNPELINFIEFQPADGPTAAGKELSCTAAQGSVKCVLVGLGSAALLPSGEVAYLRISAVNGGSSATTVEMPLSLESVYAVDGEGTSIPTTVAPATLTIESTSEPDPDPDPEPEDPRSLKPATASLPSQGVIQFTAPGVLEWQLSPEVGTITPNGVYTAPSLISELQTVRVTAVFASSTLSANVELRPAQVKVTPGTATLAPNESVQITATVIDTKDTRISWSRTPSTVGTLYTTGVFKAPASVTDPITVTITAMSLHDRTKLASATVTIRSTTSNIAVTPQTVTLAPSAKQQFVATLTGFANKSVVWSRSPAIGTISSAGLFTAPSSVSGSTTVTVRATSVADPNRSATATVTVTPSVLVAVAPGSVTLNAGGASQKFLATVSGTTNTAVNWTISPALGTISTAGLYVAPASISSQSTVTVRATSVADPSKSATAVVTLKPPATTPSVQVGVSPSSVTLNVPGASQKFTASVSGTTNTAVTWTITPALGTISAAGWYTAPASITLQTAVIVKATSVADPSKSAAAVVTLTPPTSTGPTGDLPAGATGLVAAYSFNEGAGVVVNDSSGNRHTGAITLASWTASGRFGKALQFNGRNTMVSVGDSPDFDLIAGMTLEAWINPADISDGSPVIVKENGGDISYALYGGKASTQSEIFVRGGSTTSSTLGGALPLNQWTHVAATFDGTYLRIYHNGGLRSTKIIGHKINVSANALRIGGNAAFGEWFNGRIDEVRIYNRALTAAEIASDMNRPVTQ